MPQFVKDAGSTALTRVLSRGLGVLASVLLARALGPEGNGQYALAFLMASTTLALLNFGLPSTTIYYIAQGRFPRERVLGHLFLLHLVVTAGAMLIGWGMVLAFPQWLFPQAPRLFLLLGVCIVPGMATYRFFQSVLLGLQRFDLYNRGQVVWAVLHLGLLALAVLLLRADIVGAIVAEAVSWVLGATWFFLWTRALIPRWSLGWDGALLSRLLTYGFHSYLGLLLAFFNQRADYFLLGRFLGPRAVGIYAVAVGLAEPLWWISQTASTVLLPRVSASNDPAWQRRFTPLVTRTVLILVAPVALALAVVARPLLVLLYGAPFGEAARPLQILLIGIVAFSLSRVLAHDIAGRGRPLLNTYTSAIALVVNVGLNLLLIPWLGIEGAAWASAVSYTTLLVTKLVVYRRLSGNPWPEVVCTKKEDWLLYWRTLRYLRQRFLRYPRRP